MGAEEVQKLWDSMRASRITTPAKQVPDAPQPREHAAPLAAAPAPPDAASWATLDAFVECASRGSAALADSAVPARRAELERLHALVKAAPPELLAEAASEPLGKLLLPRLADGSERCRQVAAEASLLLVQRAPVSALALLPYAVPVLRERLVPDGATRPEPSEEVREVLVRLLHALLQAADAAVLPYGTEVVETLAAALRDDSPAAACAACAAAEVLCSALGRRLGDAAAHLAEAATPLLTHRRAAVRLAALDAVGALVQAGAAQHLLALAAFQHANEVPLSAFYGTSSVRVNYLGKLATDAHAGVRARLLHKLCAWLLRLPERADHAPLLLPYVLAGLSDEAPEVAAAAVAAVDALAEAAERDRADELREAAAYGVQTLPPPIGGRPLRDGARLLVRQHLGAVLPGCVADLRAWTEDVRPRAVALLETLLEYGDRAAARYAPTLVPALCRASADGDARVADGSARCCVLVARCMPPDAWLPLLLEHVEEAPGAARAAAVRLLLVMADAADPGDMAQHAAAVDAYR